MTDIDYESNVVKIVPETVKSPITVKSLYIVC